MMSFPRRNIRDAILLLAALCLLPLCAARGKAQSVPASVTAKLNVSVKLELGVVNLPQILRALSDKTGLSIECEPYLSDREVLAQMQNVSARDALDSLAELHDWTWQTNENGHILVARKSLRLRQSAATIPLYMQAAIPADLRRFVNAGTTLNAPGQAAVYREDTNARMVRNLRVLPKMQQMIAHLIDSLDTKALVRVPLKWEQMTSEQQQSLAAMYVLKALRRTDFNLLHDDHYPYLLNLDNIVVTMQGEGHLHVGTITKSGEREVWDGIIVVVGPNLEVAPPALPVQRPNP